MMRWKRPLSPLPDHAGLAYDVWAPLDGQHKMSDHARDQWLDEVARIPTPKGYDMFIARWKSSLAGADHRLLQVQTRGRLLVGHGNWSPTGVGLTLHRTWGVPVVPGSAIKGVMAHLAAATRGNEDPEWAGPTLDEKNRVCQGPGNQYRRMFGAPPLDEDADRGQRGAIIVHDGLWDERDGAMFARDVLTPHHQSYYSGDGFPNDWESPVPVPFLSVRPHARFVFALSCVDPALTEIERREFLEDATDLLTAVLQEYGVGGKTAAGYGRFGPLSEETA